MKKEMYDTIDGRVLRSFEIIKKVGQGAYGQVWKARNKKTGATCALKKIYEAFRNATDAQKAYREIRYLQKLDHPSIVRLLAIHRPSNSRDVYLQLQFMEADLCVALKNSVLKEIHKHYIFYQLANTLSYLHAAQLVHRDIKPANILVNETCEVKLCDFGLIRSLRRQNQNEELVLTENIATRWYRAPEILLCSTNYGKAIDVWSMGCVLAEMVMQRPIFQGSSTISQLERIFEVTGKPTAADLDYIKNKSSINVIENMDIKERKGIRQLLNTNDKHIIDLLEKIFQVDPRKRPTALQVLNHPFVDKFRGKVEEKLPLGPISILYEIKQLAIEDYKKLIFGEVDEKDLKVTQLISNAEEMIYKTMPNDLGRKNVIANYPWGNLEKKSPLHSSNMGQKSFSPFAARQKREDKPDEASQQRKMQRHSPSFLQNRKKQGVNPTKTPEKLTHTPLRCDPIPKSPSQNEGGHRLIKKWTFPIANRNSMSPQKNQAPPIIPSKMISKVNSATNLVNANPEKAPQCDSKLQTIYELKHSQQFFRDSEFHQLKRHNTIDMSKSKEKKGPPKFLLQNEKRSKEITPNKQKNERPNLIPSKSPIKIQYPFSKGGTNLLQQSLNFRSNNLCPNFMPAKMIFLPPGGAYSRMNK